MVFLTRFLRRMSDDIKKPRKHYKSKFFDSLRLHVQGGSGGMGYPKYGGAGGSGGNVYIEVKEGTTMKDILRTFKLKRVRASDGVNSSSRCIQGMQGAEVTITGPPGITVYDQLGKNLGELNEEGHQLLLARGGAGGCVDNGFSGTRGQSQVVTIDLKLIADVGFVGFPNAGKSTLLARLSKARPKIASYPFTTIKPNIGVMEFPDLRQITLADLPGLVEGAHCNIGMGHDFLRHVERTKLLLVLVDVGGFRLNPKHAYRNCLETVVLLNKELELYKEDLLDKPAILIINKMDTDGAQQILADIKGTVQNLADVIPNFDKSVRPIRPLHFTKVLDISAEMGSICEIDDVKRTIRSTLDLIAETNDETRFKKETELLNKLQERIFERRPIVV